jgi:hypothetical protein
MLTRMLLLTSAVFGGLVFLAGAWPGPISSVPQNPHPGFVPHSFPLDPDIIGSGVGASELLKLALDKLDWNQVIWLHTKIRQTMSDPESGFVAEGFLQRGPNQCAHLELAINTNGGSGRLLVVSDGETVACVSEAPNTKATATAHSFPSTGDISNRNEFLRALNCGGPIVSLKEIHTQLRNGKLQTGLLHERKVIQVAGTFDPGENRASTCQVYLDAQTLWPCQIEWWGCDASNRLVPIMRIEYANPAINTALSLEECERLFSYQPAP